MPQAFPVYDCHVHIFPAHISEKAVAAIGKFYNIQMYASGEHNARTVAKVGANTGSIANYYALCYSNKPFHGMPYDTYLSFDKDFIAKAPELAQYARKYKKNNMDLKITHCIIMSAATRPDQVQSINDFLAKLGKNNDNIIPFMTMHQDFEDKAEELDRALKMGLRGLKMHHDNQLVNADDERFFDIYAEAERQGVPVTLHTGDYRYTYTHPMRILHIKEKFPKLRINAAHMGGWSLPFLGSELLSGKNIYVDTSSSQYFIGVEGMRFLIDKFGVDHVMFGSDFPMSSPSAELEFLLHLGLKDSQIEKICYKNIQEFLGNPS
ncbi:MAG: amidohydrolase family protein [Eggerthellaceae bacterium]|nr:amidohydrolase family protein [Eggerthellaceae bacterium]